MGKVFYLFPQQTQRMERQELRNSIERVFKEYRDASPAKLAELILDICGRKFPFQIGELAKTLGFTVGEQEIPDDRLSGFIACDDNLTPHKMIIRLNDQDSKGHKRFTIAHELWHYFEYFDVIGELAKNGGFYSTYRTDYAEAPEEKKANDFAANLLMPAGEFVNMYLACKLGRTEEEATEALKLIFGVTDKAIDIRKATLGLRER